MMRMVLKSVKTAVRRCFEEQKINKYNYPVRDQAVGAGAAIFLNLDFFGDGWIEDVQLKEFDLVYDYTVSILAQCPAKLDPKTMLNIRISSSSRRFHLL